MDRSEAIGTVLDYISQIGGEWGRGGGAASEAVDVLSALGVTHDELTAHNVIKGGFYHQMFMNVAELAGRDADSERLLTSIRREIAVTLDSRDPAEKGLRAKLFGLAPEISPCFAPAQE
jgi:hypothetical protein